MNNSFGYRVAIRLLAVVCFSLATINRAFSIDQEELNRIYRSGILNEMEKFVKRLQVTSITLEGVNDYFAREETEKILIKKNGQLYLLKSEHSGKNVKPASDICYGMNSIYSFELVKNKYGTAWTISRLVFITPEFDERKQGFRLAGPHGGFRSIVDDSISDLITINLYGKSVSPEKLLELPGFEWKSISTDGANDRILRTSFSYEITDSKTKQTTRSACMLDFDLNTHSFPTKLHQSYVLESKEVSYDWQQEWLKQDDNTYGVKLETKAKIASALVPSRSDEFKFRSEKRVILHDLPESDFTVSAFGFPEPPGVEWKKPFPWYLVVAGIGTACLGVFFFLRARTRRLRGG